MAYKALLFGTDDLFEKLKPFYLKEVERGNLEIVGHVLLEDGKVTIVDAAGKRGGVEQSVNFELAIISSQNDFYRRMKFLEARGIPRNQIIDGRVFRVPNLDFPRLVKEGVAYGFLENEKSFRAGFYTIYPQVCRFKNSGSLLVLGRKSYIEQNSVIEGGGFISVKNFSSISWDTSFNLLDNDDHNYCNVSAYAFSHMDWTAPAEFHPPKGSLKILIGNDVWCGRGTTFKCSNPLKPLVIGDGAVIASDSVVVKNIPPYAIVGGNPAKIIKFRFSEDVIETLLRIKWWDWDIDKIHDNFKYFNDVEKFISLHDK
ncbi:MAG: CatB-related O-acetyltransferase [Selenomonadaceae bacterium]|nr:CatB-related O-acetyltransferase [Selenomonadaceae bacterium]MBQ9498061.1 CatB-related O-acetyltransferase [Selenomonadaceae bacterium]